MKIKSGDVWTAKTDGRRLNVIRQDGHIWCVYDDSICTGLTERQLRELANPPAEPPAPADVLEQMKPLLGPGERFRPVKKDEHGCLRVAGVPLVSNESGADFADYAYPPTKAHQHGQRTNLRRRWLDGEGEYWSDYRVGRVLFRPVAILVAGQP